MRPAAVAVVAAVAAAAYLYYHYRDHVHMSFQQNKVYRVVEWSLYLFWDLGSHHCGFRSDRQAFAVWVSRETERDRSSRSGQVSVMETVGLACRVIVWNSLPRIHHLGFII